MTVMSKAIDKLTHKQRMIVKSFTGSASETARNVGCSKAYVSQCLKKPNVIKALKERELNPTTSTGNAIATREQRQAFWSHVIMSEDCSMADRLRASELLGRSNADFTDKSLVGSLDKEIESMSDEEIKRRVQDNLKLINGKKTGTEG